MGKAGADAPLPETDRAVISLKIDGSLPDAQVREVVEAPSADEGFKTPCSISGLMAGLSGGALGYVFGFGGYWLRTRTSGSFRPSLAEGWSSAKTFGVMGGIYAAVSCLMLRLRQKQDAWNGAASGCATGLALGWSGGPLASLQSCAMLGAFSYFLDGMAGGDAANAASLHSNTGGGGRLRGGRLGERGGRERSAIEMLLLPAMPLMAALQPCRTWGRDGGAEAGACRVPPRRCA